MVDASKSSGDDSAFPLRGSVIRYDDPFGSCFPIEPKIVRVDGADIYDWKTFHAVSSRVFGFPDFYGNNLSAWIDCMSDLRIDSKMSKFLLESQQILQIEIVNTSEWKSRAGDVLNGFLDVVAAVNQRLLAVGEMAGISVVFM